MGLCETLQPASKRDAKAINARLMQAQTPQVGGQLGVGGHLPWRGCAEGAPCGELLLRLHDPLVGI